MGKMGNIQKILFAIFATCILILGVYIVNFSEKNRELLNRNNSAIEINDSSNRVSLKNDSISFRNDSIHFKNDSIIIKLLKEKK
jgi:hypothetical protein